MVSAICAWKVLLLLKTKGRMIAWKLYLKEVELRKQLLFGVTVRKSSLEKFRDTF